MIKFLSGLLAVCCAVSTLAAAETPTATLSGMKNPESVCYGPEGLLYVTEIGEAGKDGDGKVTVIRDGKAEPFATGLDDPKGMVYFRDALYVTDVTKIVKVDAHGKTEVFAAAKDFPQPPIFLNDIAADAGDGIFLVSDSGKDGKGGAAYRIDVRLHKIESIASTKTIPELKTPNGIAFDGASHVILADMAQGALYRVRIADKTATKFAEGMEGADGLIWDPFGRLFITSWTTGKTFAIPRPGVKPILIGEGLKSAADCWLDNTGKNLLIPDMKAGTLTTLPTKIAGWEVDDSPLAIQCQLAFPKLEWTGWDNGQESGKPIPLRPILLTHAGDGSNRVYVPIEQGTIHVFENDDNATKTKVFLDISDRVSYSDNQNEEGLLGMAFHPKFKQNGEFFVFYTEQKSKLTNVVSRFRVSKTDPTKADPASEEQLLRIEKPFWNHNGGTIAFGPDGYLYITHGDGGSGGDPQKNGQNVGNLLGKILRIDVDRKADGKAYAIPSDNPFAKQAGAAPEIFAYGLRNVWRFAFDSKTGQLWAADVGQGLFEEIDLIKSGGNYGWSKREGLHPFGELGVDTNADMIDPIWEYHHSLGVSITGGQVYRGKAIPELDGCYLYGDYVSHRMWALKYDEKLGRVVANRPFKGNGIGLMSFGEDNKGELYVTGATATGRSIYRIVKSPAEAK